jgi:hypothetical protein
MASRAKELAAAADCGMQAVRAIRIAERQPMPPEGAEWWQDLDLAHAVRMACAALYHAFRARPDLKRPDNYDLALLEAGKGAGMVHGKAVGNG